MRAKPAVPIAGVPLVARILRWAGASGVRHAVLNLHHRPETITACVGDGGGLGVQVRYSWENPLLGSAGGPRRALPLLGAGAFFIINGDTLTNVDLQALANDHRETGAHVTLAVMPHRWPGRYGGVVIDAIGRVHGFVPRGSAAAAYHFVGVQIAEPSVFASLPDGTPSETTQGLYRTLIATNPGSIRAFLCHPDFIDVGTPADYLSASLTVAGREGFTSPPSGARSRIDPSARLVDTVVWDDVEVGAGAELDGCVIADGVSIPPGSRFRNSVIVQSHGALEVCEIPHG